MTKSPQLLNRYSISFKQKIVEEIETGGKSISEIRRIYGIKGANTVQNWLKSYGKHHLLNKIVRIEMKGEKDRIKELEAEVKRLKIALADSVLERDVLQNLVDIVDEHYKTDVKKNLGQLRSTGRTKSKDTA